MLGQKYTVKKGDSLWAIAHKHLDKPTDWPKIYDWNNTPSVVAASGQKIINPNLIFIGQKIYIPPRVTPKTAFSHQPPSLKPSPPKNNQTENGKKIALTFRGIPFTYELSDLPSSTLVEPIYIAKISLKGKITIQKVDASKLLETAVSKSQLVMTNKRETDMALNKLVTQNTIHWNPKSNELEFENGITLDSNIPYTPSFTISAGVSSETKLPMIKATAECKPIKGRIKDFVYAIANLGIEIEITPRVTPPTAKSAIQRPFLSSHEWHVFEGVVSVVGAGAFVFAMIGQDFFTGGAGLADNAAGLAVAAELFHHGMKEFKTVPGQYPIRMENSNI